MCACCAVVGVAVGFGLGRAGGGGKEVVADARKADDAGRKQAGKVSSSRHDRYPDIAELKTPEQWRGYIEQWITAGFPNKGDNRWNVLECLRRWSEIDAEGVLAFVHGVEKFSERDEAYAIPLAAIGRKDMPRVIEWMRTHLPEEDDRGDVATHMIRELEYGHPWEAWMLATADGIPLASHYLSPIMQRLVKTNPADALRAFNALPDELKEVVANRFVMTWASVDLNAAINWCAAQAGKDYAEQAKLEILQHLAHEKPSGIVAAIEKMGVTFDSSEYYGIFMNYLMDNDPLVALEVLQKMPPEQMRKYGEGVVLGLFQTDADQAVAAAQALFPDGQRESVIYQSYQKWLRSDRKAAEEWLAKEADSGVREQIKIQRLAKGDPTVFLATLGSVSDLSGAFMQGCLDDALFRAALYQPNEALRWLLANPDQITDKRLHSGISVTIADIETLPQNSKGREVLINYALSNSLHNQNWDTAANLLPLLTDTAKQDRLRFKVFSSMMSKASKREAREWLATQPLSDEVRASWETIVGQ